MVLLLENLVVFKCEMRRRRVKRLTICEANLGLPGNPVIIVCVVMQEFNAADCGQNTVEKVEDRLASADQRAFATAPAWACSLKALTAGSSLRAWESCF
jgi:hypothetical protein